MNDSADDLRIKSALNHTNHHLWQYLFELSPQPIAFISTEGKFLKANPAFCKFVEYTDIELCNKTFLEITPPDDGIIDWNNLEKVRRGETDSYSMIKSYITKSGNIVKMIVTVFAIRQEGYPLYYVKYIVPIRNGMGAKIAALQEQIKKQTSLTIYQRIGELITEHWPSIVAIGTSIIAIAVFFIQLKNSLDTNNELLRRQMQQGVKQIDEDQMQRNQELERFLENLMDKKSDDQQ